MTEWLQSEMDRLHRLPEQLLDEHTATLNQLPYKWSYGYLGLRIIDAAAEPQHSCFWSPRQWSWWADYPISNEEARRILEDHGYYRREMPEAAGQ